MEYIKNFKVKRTDFFDRFNDRFWHWESGRQQFAIGSIKSKGLFELFVMDHSINQLNFNTHAHKGKSTLEKILKQSYDHAAENHYVAINIGFNKFYKTILKILTSDSKLMRFGKMMSEIGVKSNDVRIMNLGTRTGNEILLIDISIFGA